MYLIPDSLGRSEIVGGWRDEIRQRQAQIIQINNLRKRFFDAFNEAILYKKPFKNPLDNKDIAWLYEIASQPSTFFDPHPPEEANELLQDIEHSKKLAREKYQIPGDY
jgi:hypothetical protein